MCTTAALFLSTPLIADNQARGTASALYVQSAGRNSSPRLLHATIARNGSSALTAGTGGDGSGIYVTDDGYGFHSTLAMTNTILFSHTVGITVTTGNTATLNATLWHNNGTKWSGNVLHANDHEGDPAFAADGYHLRGNSAAIDQGVNAGVTSDLDGETRPQDGGYDLGADEAKVKFKLYLPLVLRN